ncbi:phosphomannomutase [Eubacteriales bacterium OttesenSCG-928-A19]|nr:phosphomannomutase [Eubacteriales bacterium OttesenSCG-928-A19]
MDTERLRLIALDMDGTITQHRTPIEPYNKDILRELGKRYHLVVVGAGDCMRIHRQLREFPIDVIGNYGMSVARYDPPAGLLRIDAEHKAPVADRDAMVKKANMLRAQFGFEQYEGDTIEFHASGMMTFALLGTQARIEDKLAFDPDRSRRKPLYPAVCEAFDEYTVFIGGSSSFDIVPRPFNKLYALERFCADEEYAVDEVVFIGDDYGVGGNDEQVYRSEYAFITVDNYKAFDKAVEALLR